jgi:ABC-type phosphate transport system substrate-binding protein
MKLRLLALAMALAVVGAFVLAPLSASAAKPTTSIASVPATGTVTATATGTVTQIASLSIVGFTTQNGALAAVVNLFDAAGNLLTQVTVPVSASGTCRVLDLTLGPLHLDLLGLVVDLNAVHLQITAQSGPGNLLGNLLCAVANLLNGGLNVGTALNQLVNLLNQLLGAL